jgi:hypothetical protein
METHMTKKKQTTKSETKKSAKSKKADSGISVAPVNQAAAPAVQPVNGQPAAQRAPAASAPPRAAKAAPAPKAPREMRNGVRRPKEGGKCWQVWNYLDANPTTTTKEIREAATSKGWNVNNASIELSQWRRFTGTAKVSAAT